MVPQIGGKEAYPAGLLLAKSFFSFPHDTGSFIKAMVTAVGSHHGLAPGLREALTCPRSSHCHGRAALAQAVSGVPTAHTNLFC